MSTSYPPNPRTGIPTNIIVSPQNITILRGATIQLSPALTDVNSNTVSPIKPFTFASSNPGLVSVNEDGLCTAALGNPNELQTGGTVEIEVSYPWANGISSAKIYTFVRIVVTVQPGVSIFLGDVCKLYPAS